VDPAVPADLARRSARALAFRGRKKRRLWQRKSGANIRVRLSGRLIDAHDASPALFAVIVATSPSSTACTSSCDKRRRWKRFGQLAGGVAHDFNKC